MGKIRQRFIYFVIIIKRVRNGRIRYCTFVQLSPLRDEDDDEALSVIFVHSQTNSQKP